MNARSVSCTFRHKATGNTHVEQFDAPVGMTARDATAWLIGDGAVTRIAKAMGVPASDVTIGVLRKTGLAEGTIVLTSDVKAGKAKKPASKASKAGNLASAQGFASRVAELVAELGVTATARTTYASLVKQATAQATAERTAQETQYNAARVQELIAELRERAPQYTILLNGKAVKAGK